MYKKSLLLDDSFVQAIFEWRERRRIGKGGLVRETGHDERRMEERMDGQCGREEVRDVVERAHIGE